jgi:hypothetical protein
MQVRDVSQPSPPVAGSAGAPDPKPIHRSPGLIAILGLASIVMFVLAMAWPDEGAFWGQGVSTAIAWLFFVVHIVATRRLLNAFDLLIWIPVVFLLQYLGMAMAIEWLGYAAPTGYDGFPVGRLPKHIELGFMLSAMSVVALLFGIHLAGIRDLSRVEPAPRVEKRSVLPAALALYWGGIAMILVGIPIAGPEVIFGAYGAMKVANIFGQADFRLFQGGMLFLQGGIFGLLVCYRRERPGLLLLGAGGAAVLLTLLLLTGDRGGMSSVVFGAGWAFALRVRRVPHWLAVSAFSVAMVLMPAIGEWREWGEVNVSTSPKDLLVAPIYEMGAAVQALSWSLELIPSTKPYTWGTSYLAQLANNLPNFGPTVGGGLPFDYNPYVHLPSFWFTGVMNPVRHALKGGGWAYSFAAEWYFNFGIAGILLGQIFTGWASARIRNASANGTFMAAAACLFMAMMSLAVRNAIGYPMRTALWPLVGLSILYWVLPQPEVRRAYAQPPAGRLPRLRSDAGSRTEP